MMGDYSWAIAFDAVLVAASEATAGGMDVFYMGYNLEMGREFIDYCADWAKHFGHAAADVEEYIWVDPDDAEKSVQAFRIRFAGLSLVSTCPIESKTQLKARLFLGLSAV
ncbi:MAG: hypothetical protein PHW76_07895 [Alphaproteobacteria bacterium]|nr:hypothetical protein [Alphaproteobacteria bacterium]